MPLIDTNPQTRDYSNLVHLISDVKLLESKLNLWDSTHRVPENEAETEYFLILPIIIPTLCHAHRKIFPKLKINIYIIRDTAQQWHRNGCLCVWIVKTMREKLVILITTMNDNTARVVKLSGKEGGRVAVWGVGVNDIITSYPLSPIMLSLTCNAAANCSKTRTLHQH